jgi:putative tricarboxylic transport membrane protein
MRVAEVVTASVLMLLGIIVIFDAVRLGFRWGANGPQSVLSVLAGFDHGALLRGDHRASDTARRGKEIREPGTLGPVLKVLWPAVVAVALMQYLGLYVASALYTGFYIRWVGRHSWITVFAFGVGIPVVIFLIFEKWFLVPMPKGPLEEWLGY